MPQPERRTILPGHLSYMGGALYHNIVRDCTCRVCGAAYRGPVNGKYCKDCRKEGRRRRNGAKPRNSAV